MSAKSVAGETIFEKPVRNDQPSEFKLEMALVHPNVAIHRLQKPDRTAPGAL